MKNCCVNCFEDDAIREFIEGSGNVGDCDYCGSKGALTGDLATIGDFVREGLARAYDDASTVEVRTSRDEECLGWGSTTTFLENEAGITDVARAENLAHDLLDTFSSQATMYEYIWLDADQGLIAPKKKLFEFYGLEEANAYTSAWDFFKSRVMHETRFFDIGEPRERIIAPVSGLFLKLESVLKSGITVFRARLAHDWLPIDPWEIQQTLGPPPSRSAQHNRMSPQGISYLYVSEGQETCVAEIQPNVGREVWVAQFLVLNDIKLLDFTRLPSIEIRSIFSTDYDPDLEWAKFFLQGFLSEISQPPRSKDDLLEYVPTQVLAEYIRAQGYQGIAYQSAQHPEGVNYTLFCSPDADPRIDHKPDRPIFHEWLRIEEVNKVRINGLKLETSTVDTQAIDPATLKNPNDSGEIPH